MNSRPTPPLRSIVMKSRFFVAAVLVHVLLGLLLVGRLLIPDRAPHVFERTVVAGPETPRAPEREAERTPTEKALEESAPPVAAGNAGAALGDLIQADRVIMAELPTPGGAVMPVPGINAVTPGTAAPRLPQAEPRRVVSARWDAGRKFLQPSLKSAPGAPDHRLVAEFTCVVGRPARGGDAMAFLRVDEQQRIYGGSLVNLNEMINRFSHGRVKARLEAQAVALDSPDLIEKHIPYVFLTGRRDFQLTDAEITNLRAYLNRGGCLWGDSGVPGRRSAFDVAFRREMRRLIPDPDKSFEALPPSHPVYRESFFPLAGAPAGLNRSREPVEVIKIEGVEAVIYTSNGYGAMWQATLDDEMKRVDRAIMTQAERVAYAKRSILFRNWEEAALLDSYRLGVNMTTYLLTRFQRGLDGG